MKKAEMTEQIRPSRVDKQVPDTAVLPWSEFRNVGLLWLVNASCLHARGFALAFVYPDSATREEVEAGEVEPIGWDLLGDGSEPWVFFDPDDDPGKLDRTFASVERFLAEHRATPTESRDAQESDEG